MPRKGLFFPEGTCWFFLLMIFKKMNTYMYSIIISDPGKSLFYCIAMKKLYRESKISLSKLSKSERKTHSRKWRKEVSKDICEKYLSKFPDYDSTVLDDLYKIEKEFRCKIYLWGKMFREGKYQCLREGKQMPATDFDDHVDVILENPELEINLNNVGLILEVDETFPPETRLLRKTWSLFEAYAIQKNPKLITNVACLRSATEKAEADWGKLNFHVDDAIEFYEKFKVNVQIWTINQIGPNRVFRHKVWDRRGMPKLIGKALIC